jgi:cell division protein FtsB
VDTIDLTLVEEYVDEEPAPPVRRRRGWTRSPFLAFGLVVVLAGTLSGVIPFRDILARNRQVEITQEQLDAVRAENALLEEQINAVQSTAGVERLAREQFGLVYEGEVSYVVETTTVEPTPADAPLSLVDPSPWYAKIWNYLTGRDLVPDEQS